MTDTTDRDILLGAVEEFCDKRVRDAAWAERERVVKYLRSLAASPSIRAHQPEIAAAIASTAQDIEDEEHLHGE